MRGRALAGGLLLAAALAATPAQARLVDLYGGATAGGVTGWGPRRTRPTSSTAPAARGWASTWG
ncbi:MAG TPA: hypothetical protein VN962_26610 [Polyangia bacterium]|nr:hypothetical protein [Polyangia bacterium]